MTLLPRLPPGPPASPLLYPNCGRTCLRRRDGSDSGSDLHRQRARPGPPAL